MKRHIKNVLPLVPMLLLLSMSCTEELNSPGAETTGKKQINLWVEMPGEAVARVAYDDSKAGSPGNDALTWQEGDQLTVTGYDAGGEKVGEEIYTLNSGDAGKTRASFTGNAIEGAVSYYVCYGDAKLEYIYVDGEIFLVYVPYLSSSQMQEGDGSTAHLRDNIILTAKHTALDNITLEMRSSLLKFSLSNVPVEVGTLQKLVWTVETANGSESITLNFSAEEGKKVVFGNGKSDLTAYLAFLPGSRMAVKPDGKFGVTLVGDRTYRADKILPAGKTYEAGKRYTAVIDGTAGTMVWEEEAGFTVKAPPVAEAAYHYNGLTMQIGSWNNETPKQQVVLGSAVIADGKALFPADILDGYADKPIWICIPKVAKFFHTLTAEKLSTKELTLPDKESGSTLKPTPAAGGNPYVNNWIIALYMNVNKNGSTAADAVPIYWATGTLIATKIGENSGETPSTVVAFHISTIEELIAQGRNDSPYDKTPEGISSSPANGYSGCAVGAQWNLFGWGDPTGLKTSIRHENYAPSVTSFGESICGTEYDIARVQLGGNWRLPTGGTAYVDPYTSDHEFAAFDDENFSGLEPNGENWMEGTVFLGARYTYTCPAENGQSIPNTLLFPATGYRTGTELEEPYFFAGWCGTAVDEDYACLLNFWEGGFCGNNSRIYGQWVPAVTE